MAIAALMVGGVGVLFLSFLFLGAYLCLCWLEAGGGGGH